MGNLEMMFEEFDSFDDDMSFVCIGRLMFVSYLDFVRVWDDIIYVLD